MYGLMRLVVIGRRAGPIIVSAAVDGCHACTSLNRRYDNYHITLQVLYGRDVPIPVEP
jgi:hypothetical protein